MRKVGILIAVEDYSDKRISRVKYARADAEELGAALQHHGFAPVDQSSLIDVAATKTSIESCVRRVLGSLTKTDTLYFYYAGHGFARNTANYITCYDTNVDDLEQTSIPVEWLFRAFRKSACKRIILFLDSCESGMLASAAVRGIYTDLTEDELNRFFEDAEHCVCFAACKAGESSHPADTLKHGIWTYHLIEALKADAPGALENGHLLTSSSLQNYLALQVPRTLRKTRTGTCVQTPWAYGALSSDFLVADVSSILAKRKSAANPGARQLRYIRLYHEQSSPVRRLSGFQKTHRVPDGINPATERFIERIAAEDINKDIDEVHAGLRQAFGFKRKDLETRVSDDGGSIITPYFDYELTVSLNSEDTSEVIWCREVVNIRDPDRILAKEFEDVFGNMFDTLEFATGTRINLGSIVDQVESLNSDSVTVDYDKGLTWCEIRIDGVDSIIRVTPHAFSLIQPHKVTPKMLINSFFKVQKRLVDTHQLKQLPFNESKKGM